MFWTKNSVKASAGAKQSRTIRRAAKCAVETLELRLLLSVNVTSYHYDQSETGANTNEAILTPSNVNVNTFGKLATLPTDGQVYAQPLIVTGVSMPGGGTEDLVFIATENDSVYAFNADATSTTPVWKTSLLQTGEQPIPYSTTGSANIAPIVGITGTPVIDTTTNTLYCVGNFEETATTTYQQRLYALNITTGAVVDGGPVVIAATVNGTGPGSSGGKLPFNPLWQNQRTALTLANGNVYFAFASHGDQNSYHGWVMGYNATTLVQDYVWCNTPNGSEGGIWMSGGGLAVDSSGDLYLTSGNGSFGPSSSNYAMAFVKLSPSLSVLDYFSPYNESTLSGQDNDYGCGNAILLPPQGGSAPNEALTAGKWGGIYLNNTVTGSMGEFTSTAPNHDLSESSTGGSLHNTFSYWNNTLYIGADGEKLKAFPVANGTIAATPSSQSALVFGAVGGNGQGCSPTESSNGTSNGIVWVIDNNAYNGIYNASATAILMAFDASDLTKVLYTSNQAGGGADVPGSAIQFTTPVVANGFVYVGTGTGVAIYGNHPYVPPPPPPPPPPAVPPGAITGFNKFTLNAGSTNPAGVPAISTDKNTLTVTTNAGNEASSAIYNTPVNYQNFTAEFTYTDTQGNPPADGVSFMLENDPRGAAALGGAGGLLGYSTITPSFAVELNVYQGSTTGDATNGGARLVNQGTGSVNLSSGDPIDVVLTYNASTQTVNETLTDLTASAGYSTSYTGINLSSILGSGTAYIGFTGGTGGAESLQTITKFAYFTQPLWLATTSAASWNAANNTLTVTGPTTIYGDPGTDEPNIVASGASAQVTIEPFPHGVDVHVGGISLSNGASIVMPSVGAYSTAGRTHNHHNTLVVGTLGAASDPTFSIDSSSKLDLQDNDLVVHTGSSDSTGQSELAAVRALAATGRNVPAGSVLNGTWTGNGLTSSSAASADAKAGLEQNVLAVVLNSDQVLGTDAKWTVGSSSETLGAHDILVKYTYNGDAALEGYVGDDSVTIVNGLYDGGKSTQPDWAFGDFTGSGKVDDNDITILNGLYGNGTAASALPQL